MADSSTTGRNFILAGVVLGLGAAAAGFYISGSVENQAVSATVRGSSNVPTMVQKVKASYDDAVREVVVTDIAPANAYIVREKTLGPDGKYVKNPAGKTPRYTPLFFAPKLWLSVEAGSSPDKGKVVDLLASGDAGASLHKNVPNEWFFRYGLDELIVKPDAMEIDTDGDGYTNAEEFVAETDPTDAASHPAFIVDGAPKMVWVKRSTDSHWLELSQASDFLNPDGVMLTINVYKTSDYNVAGRCQHKDKKVGDSFGLAASGGTGALAPDRFKILSVKTGGAQGNSIELEDTFAKTEADKQKTLSAGRKNVLHLRDTQVSFRVTAGPEKGKEIAHVQLGESFEVPGYPGTTCTLISTAKSEIKVKIGEQEFKIEQENPAPKEKK